MEIKHLEWGHRELKHQLPALEMPKEMSQDRVEMSP